MDGPLAPFIERRLMSKLKKAEIILEYQNYVETPPITPENLYKQACSNDTVTINAWRATWISNVRKNHEKYGPFKNRSIGKLYASQQYKPTIIVGSGPSLKRNLEDLKFRGQICVVSCLHNFHALEDNGTPADYYVTLDAGDVTVEEVSEGGARKEEEYWAMTEKRTLLAYIGTSPKLLEKWRGEVLFYNCPVPDEEYMKEVKAVEEFNLYVGTGGNVLGACLYIAKGILGSSLIAFMGADFAFSYDKKFHAWDSKYDAHLGRVIKSVDVFGNKVLTWQSYANFKGWFESVAMRVPGLYVNCTEGGTFGAYPEGNVLCIKQMDLLDFLNMHHMHDHLKEECANPDGFVIVKDPVTGDDIKQFHNKLLF